MPLKKPPEKKKNVCLACKKVEAPPLKGTLFTATGENGMLLKFWMCAPCAIAASDGQGAITLQDPTTRI